MWAAVGYPGVDYATALNMTFLQAYDYPPFLLALGFSAVGVCVGAGIEACVRRVRGLEYPEFSLKASDAIEGAEGLPLEVGKGEERGDTGGEREAEPLSQDIKGGGASEL